MRVLIVIFGLVLNWDIAHSQVNRDTLEIIMGVCSLEEIDTDLFNNQDHPANSIFILKNSSVESDSAKRNFPTVHEYGGLNLLLYPRKYIVGHYVTYWLVFDDIRILGSNAMVRFKTVFSKDNWFEENDETHIQGVLSFRRVAGGSWKVVKKDIEKFPLTR